MAYQDALTLLAQMLQLPDAPTTKAIFIAMMQAGDPPIDASAFILGEPTERWLDAAATALNAWGAVPTMATRALFLHLATDPGDVADDGTPDQSADQTPRPGWLSVTGAGWFGTLREEALFATVSVTVSNATGGAVNIKPFELTVERSYVGADGGSPTYRNTPDPAVYVNFDGSVTIANGASVVLTFEADQIGSYASATAASITVLVTQTFGALTVSNPSATLGQDRESRASYIARCLTAADSNAPGGPINAYRRAATTAKSGGPLLNYSTGAPVGITGVQVLPDSTTGVVTGYFYGPSGHVGVATDLSTANANILGVAVGLLTDPIGVLPDCVVIGPEVADPVTGAGFADVTNTPIAVTYSAKIKASMVVGGATPGTYTSGGSPPAPIANIFTAIGIAIAEYLVNLGPGALDQTAGAGVVYTPDIGDTIREAQAGLYNVVLTVPGTSSTAIAVGHIATQGSTSGTLVVV
jgi:hypothetical protein